MYENEIYSGENKQELTEQNQSVPQGQQAQSAEEIPPVQQTIPNVPPLQQAQQAGGNPYFDYTAGTQYNAYQSQGTVYTGQPAKKQKKEKKKPGFFGKFLRASCIGLAFGVLAGFGFYGVCRATGVFEKADQVMEMMQKQPSEYQSVIQQVPAIKETTTQNYDVSSSDVSGLVEQVMPAMVSILNTSVEQNRIWGQVYSREYQSSGSGIISAENGDELLIVTNYHVVEGASKLEVTFIDGEKAEAKVKGMDSDMDLAVIAVSLQDLKNSTKESIAVARMGDSNTLKLGEPVVVIGNALGYGQSVTNGIISGLDRTLEDTEGSFIQTNAAVNPGNSGGALLNEDGEVIGIVSNKIGGSIVEGMGYAIPISAANPIIADLMDRPTRGDVVATEEMGYMGVILQSINEEQRVYFGFPKGVMVAEVTKGSGADVAGIKYGDCIAKIQGEKVTSFEEVQQIMQYYRAGDVVQVDVKRLIDGEYKDLQFQVTLGKRPEE